MRRFAFRTSAFVIAAMVAFFVGVQAENSAATAQKGADGKFERTEPEKKRFVLTLNYPYRERIFDPPVLVKKLKAKPQGMELIPENVLISHISAMKNLDFDWWLDTFTAAERPTVLKRLEAAGKSKEDLVEEWKKSIVSASVTIERWMVTRKYIILTYKTRIRDPKNKNSIISSKETAVTFKLSDLRMNVTLDLENDPVVLYFDAGTSRIERVIR